MKRVVFFHMGAHKTATTLLQIRLRERRRSLARAGIAYLAPREIKHSAFERHCASGEGSQEEAIEYLDAAIARAGDGQKVLVVFEDMLGGTRLDAGDRIYPEARERLDRLVAAVRDSRPDWTLNPIYVVRRYDRYWFSCYRHEVKRGKRRDFSSAVRLLEKANASWRPVVEDIEAACGHAIPVRCYEDLDGLNDGDFVKVFLDVAGLSGRGIDVEPRWFEGIRRKVGSLTDLSRKILSARPNPPFSERGILLAEAIRPLVTQDEWDRHFRPLLTRYFNRFLEEDTGSIAVPDAVEEKMRRQYLADREWLGDRLRLTY